MQLWERLAGGIDCDPEEWQELFGQAVKLVHEARTRAEELREECDEIIANAKADWAEIFSEKAQWDRARKEMEEALRAAIEAHYLGTGDRHPWPGLGIRDTEKEQCGYAPADALAWVLKHPTMHWLLSIQSKKFGKHILDLPEEAREALGLNEFVEFTMDRKVTATIAKDLGDKA